MSRIVLQKLITWSSQNHKISNDCIYFIVYFKFGQHLVLKDLSPLRLIYQTLIMFSLYTLLWKFNNQLHSPSFLKKQVSWVICSSYVLNKCTYFTTSGRSQCNTTNFEDIGKSRALLIQKKLNNSRMVQGTDFK